MSIIRIRDCCGSVSPILGFVGLPLLSAIASCAQASAVSDNLTFYAINQNPWTGGPAYVLDRSIRESVSWNRNLPNANFSPVDIAIGALGDLLGANLPGGLVRAYAGGHTSGEVGFNFGIYLSGGRVDAAYPVNVQLNLPDVATSGGTFAIGTSYTPTRFEGIVGAQCAGGGGLASQAFAQRHCNLIVDMIDPSLEASFPAFNAYAEAIASASFGVSVGAAVSVPIYGDIFGKQFNYSLGPFGYDRDNPLELATVNTSGVYALGRPIIEFGKPISLGAFGTATFNVPTFNSVGGLSGNGGLAAIGSFDDVIGIQTNPVNYISPVPLSGGFGPVGYDLLNIGVGPTLGVSQEFNLLPRLRGQIQFDKVVLVRGANGRWRPTNIVDFNVGDDVQIKMPFGLVDTVNYKTTYFLDNTFENKTGIRIGLAENIRALTLNVPVAGQQGPAFSYSDNQQLGVIPVYENDFSLAFGNATTGSHSFEVQSVFAGQTFANYRTSVIASSVEDPTQVRRSVAIATQNGTSTYILDGDDVFFQADPDPHSDFPYQVLFFADPDQAASLGLPDVFCVDCTDLSVLMPDASGFAFDDRGNRYYLGGSFDVDNLPACIACDPMFSDIAQFDASAYRSAAPIVETVDLIGSNSVDEPPSWALTLLGLPPFVRRLRPFEA